MRTNDERIEAMHRRAAQIERERSLRRSRALQVASVACCLATVVALGIAAPQLMAPPVPGAAPDGMAASMFSGSGALGYIVVALAAFALGAAVTILCYRLRRRSGDERDIRPVRDDTGKGARR